MRKSSKNWELFCVLKYPYLVRGYFIFGNKNAVFMRFVAFRKRLTNKRKRGKRNEKNETLETVGFEITNGVLTKYTRTKTLYGAWSSKKQSSKVKK